MKQMCRNYGWVLTTWHLHLASLEKQFHRKNKWVIWLDTYVQGWNVGATPKSPKPLPNEIQSVASSSTWRQMVIQRTKKVHNQKVGKKRKRQANSCKKRQANCKKSAIGFSSIILDKTKSEKEQKRTLPSAHKAWLLKTRTHGGVCSSEPMWCLGAPSILKHATLAEDNGWRLCLKTFMPYHARLYAENVYSM